MLSNLLFPVSCKKLPLPKASNLLKCFLLRTLGSWSGRQAVLSLVLLCSACVTLMTYQVVVEVCYPELVLPSSAAYQFGRFIPGAFLPVFWNVPVLHAGNIGVIVDWLCKRQTIAADVKSCLTVLYNQNRMVNAFRSSSWVTESKDSIVFRGVTTCASITAYTFFFCSVLLGCQKVPGGSPFSQHIMIRIWTKMNWSNKSRTDSFRPKLAEIKQIKQIIRRQFRHLSVVQKMVQGRKTKGWTGELTGSFASDREARGRSTGANL